MPPSDATPRSSSRPSPGAPEWVLRRPQPQLEGGASKRPPEAHLRRLKPSVASPTDGPVFRTAERSSPSIWCPPGRPALGRSESVSSTRSGCRPGAFSAPDRDVPRAQSGPRKGLIAPLRSRRLRPSRGLDSGRDEGRSWPLRSVRRLRSVRSRPSEGGRSRPSVACGWRRSDRSIGTPRGCRRGVDRDVRKGLNPDRAHGPIGTLRGGNRDSPKLPIATLLTAHPRPYEGSIGTLAKGGVGAVRTGWLATPRRRRSGPWEGVISRPPQGSMRPLRSAESGPC